MASIRDLVNPAYDIEPKMHQTARVCFPLDKNGRMGEFNAKTMAYFHEAFSAHLESLGINSTSMTRDACVDFVRLAIYEKSLKYHQQGE